MNQLSRNILSTLCYYDSLDYPLTSFEVWKNLIDAMSRDKMHLIEDDDVFVDFDLMSVMDELESEDMKNVVEEYQGFYFLKGRGDLVEKRIRKNKISVLKIKRLAKIVKIIRMTPFVRMIFVTGRLSMKSATPSSDWDLLVVMQKGRIWIGRTLITALLHLMGKRRYGNKVKDRVCLNHFVTTKSLEIIDKNLFSANEYMNCIPFFDAGEYYRKFQLKNYWIKEKKVNHYVNEVGNLRLLGDTSFSVVTRRALEFVFDVNSLEVFLRKIELEKIKRNPKTSIKGSFIEASDEALIFLPKPQGPVVFEEYQKVLEKLRVC